MGPNTLGGNMIKDWDAPREEEEEEVMEVVGGKRSIKDRLDLGAKVGEEEGSPACANPATRTTSPTAIPILQGYSMSFLT